jgi:hypothetical protein
MSYFMGEYGLVVGIICIIGAVLCLCSLYFSIHRAGYLQALDEYREWIQVGCDAAKKREREKDE